ncbi:MBL fold metallo-hydrolase [uncultured Flavobacterium sp.]|uniref:MBL fold metallo-hydrolase n=1 Tax=uncultured Flavobacterium sp. TaxID=165435 RepID=UPI0030CA2E66
MKNLSNSNRRSFIRNAGIIAGASLIIPKTFANSNDKKEKNNLFLNGQGDGFYTQKIGNKEITVISDGSLYFPDGFFAQEAKESQLKKIASKNGFLTDTTSVQVNALVIKDSNGVTLIDAGTSKGIYDTVGNFLTNFKKAGFNTSEVDRIVLTHLHFDHFGYLFDKEGKAVFPNAEIILSETEYNFWNNGSPNLSNVTADQGTKDFFISSAKEVIKNMKKQFTVKNDGQEVAPGMRMIAAPGHTPGHFAVEMEGFVYLADTFVHPWLHLPHPEWSSKVDVDPISVKASRKRILDKVSHENILVAGAHANFPSFGRIAKNGKGYDWKEIPFEW